MSDSDNNGPVTGRNSAQSGKSRSAAAEVNLSRRTVIGFLLASAGAGSAAAQDVTVLATKPLQNRPIKDLPDFNKRRYGLFDLSKNFIEFSIVRPADMLLMDVRLVDMQVTGGAKQTIKLTGKTSNARLVVTLPPQAIAESAWPDLSGSACGGASGFSGGTAFTRLSGPTRLAFRAPSGFTDMPFTAEAILEACATWPLSLDDHARPAPSASVMPEAHSFDRIRTRMSAIANGQVERLKSYPGAQALLQRAANKVAAVIADGIAQQNPPSDAEIDALIKAEIDATIPPQDTAANGAAKIITGALVVNTIIPINFDEQAPIRIRQIDPDCTDIEAPFHLHLSPLSTAGFAHATKAVSHRGITELWHTALGTRVGAYTLTRESEPLRALYADDSVTSDVGSWYVDFVKPAFFVPTGTDIANNPVRWSLTRDQRIQIAKLSTLSPPGSGYVARPVMAEHLRLTALGASMDVLGNWPDRPADMNVSQWKHVTSIGRDQFVKIVEDGYLAPFGHRAAIVTITERKIVRDPQGGYAGALMQKQFIIIRDSVRVFPGEAQRFAGRDLPFASIEITDKRTPDLAAPAVIAELNQSFYAGGGGASLAFWPREACKPGAFAFHLIGTDTAGRRVPFTLPLIFIKGDRNDTSVLSSGPDLNPGQSHVENLAVYYNTKAPEALTRAQIERPLIRFSAAVAADGQPLSGGEYDYHATSLRFGMFKAGANIAGARFYPRLAEAQLDLPAVKALTGATVAPAVTYHKTFLDHGYSPVDNKAQVVFGFAKPQSVADKPTDRFGGLMTPGLNLDGLTRTMGAVSKVESLLGGSFDPLSAIPDSAKLLGVIPLKSVLKALNVSDPSSGLAAANTAFADRIKDAQAEAQALTAMAQSAAGEAKTQALAAKAQADQRIADLQAQAAAIKDNPTALLEYVPGAPKIKTENLPDRIVTSYTVEQASLQSWPPDVEKPVFIPLTPAGGPQFSILTTLVAAKSAGALPKASVDAHLRNFRISLYGFVMVNFTALSLSVKPGLKTDVNPILDPEHGLMFGGPLEFVNTLRDVIPMGGFSDPPGIDVTPQGITSSYSMTLPDIVVGAMTLQNVNLGAGFDLPFTGGGPAVRFNFAERHSPFVLTVSLFGGGGFFALTVDTSGVKELECALEFVAQVAINLGVASGAVYVKGGFYFHWQQDKVAFSGYVEIGGYLNVLGLISVSLVFHLELTYEKAAPNTRLFGTAELVVEIDILFFSCSKSIRVEREFAGGNGDPAFIDFVPQTVMKGAQINTPADLKSKAWNDYCAAFA